MTVKELITELNKVEDKNKTVLVYAKMHDLTISSVQINSKDSIHLRLKYPEIEYDDFL